MLNEAYEYLINVRIAGSSSAKSTAESYQWSEQEWQEQQREYAKARAREHARMRYEEFVKSDYYKEQVVVDVVTLHVGILVSIFLLIVLPLVLVTNYGPEGLLPYLVVNFVLIPFHLRSYFNLKKLSLGTFKSATVDLFKITWFQITALTLVNLYAVFFVGMNTLIAPWKILFAYALISVIFYVGSRKLMAKSVITFGIAPVIISTLLLLNYYFSSNERTETYTLQTEYPYVQRDTFITLENDIYTEYPGLRIFSDYDEVQRAREIQYKMKDGLFGIKVMTDYFFIQDSSRSDSGFDVDY